MILVVVSGGSSLTKPGTGRTRKKNQGQPLPRNKTFNEDLVPAPGAGTTFRALVSKYLPGKASRALEGQASVIRNHKSSEEKGAVLFSNGYVAFLKMEKTQRVWGQGYFFDFN